jgi:hypothetical protein
MSVVESGNTASAAHYNNLRTRVINAASDFGIDLATIEVYLGTTMPAKTAGESISNEDYDKLFLATHMAPLGSLHPPAQAQLVLVTMI